MGRQGPAPKSERAEERPPPGTLPLTGAPARAEAHSSEGRGVMDTFMIEKQLEWRQEMHDYLGEISWEGVGGAREGPSGQTLRSQEGAQSGASE